MGVSAIDAEDTAVIMYTSGTTGHPKGAMLTHANIWWNNVGTMMTGEYTDNEVSLVFAPLFHIGGLNVTTLVVMQRGGHIILHRHFDPTEAIRAGLSKVEAVEVAPEDIQGVAYDVMRHRLILNFEAEAEGVTADQVIGELIGRIAVP